MSQRKSAGNLGCSLTTPVTPCGTPPNAPPSRNMKGESSSSALSTFARISAVTRTTSRRGTAIRRRCSAGESLPAYGMGKCHRNTPTAILVDKKSRMFPPEGGTWFAESTSSSSAVNGEDYSNTLILRPHADDVAIFTMPH